MEALMSTLEDWIEGYPAGTYIQACYNVQVVYMQAQFVVLLLMKKLSSVLLLINESDSSLPPLPLLVLIALLLLIGIMTLL